MLSDQSTQCFLHWYDVSQTLAISLGMGHRCEDNAVASQLPGTRHQLCGHPVMVVKKLHPDASWGESRRLIKAQGEVSDVLWEDLHECHL